MEAFIKSVVSNISLEMTTKINPKTRGWLSSASKISGSTFRSSNCILIFWKLDQFFFFCLKALVICKISRYKHSLLAFLSMMNESKTHTFERKLSPRPDNVGSCFEFWQFWQKNECRWLLSTKGQKNYNAIIFPTKSDSS